MKSLFARGPFLRKKQHPAETAGGFLQLPDAGDRVIGRADDRAASPDHPVHGELLDGLVGIFLELEASAEGVDEVFLDPAVGAFADIADRLLAGFGEM